MLAYLCVALAEGCGQSPVPALLTPDLDPAAVLAAPPRLPPAVARRLAEPGLARRAARCAAGAARMGLSVMTPDGDRYPPRLRGAPLRPLVLFARGDLDLLDAARPSVAVIGSRTPTPYGMAAARDHARTLARAGVVVWSGLAMGVDGIAHEAVLEVGGATVAVLAGGLDAIYPAQHVGLAERIVQGGGLLLSEAPPGLRARRGHFPRRNRIMACAPHAVLVVEAGAASGSLHTARFAADAGVDVFAVPGPYMSPRSEGCHALIADGAQIATSPRELLARLGVELELAGGGGDGGLGAGGDEAAVLAVLGRGPRPVDLVERESRLEAAQFLEVLARLVEGGAVIELPGDLLAAAQA